MNDSCTSQSWLELESDPGLFTLLVNNFGVENIEVEEIYDLSRPLDGEVYGFIFLFKWTDRRTRRRQIETLNYETNSLKINSMFFAQQTIPNSCATHALLSVLLNCENVKLGELLSEFKANCKDLTPEQKGAAIGSQTKLFKAHNSYAKPDSCNSYATDTKLTQSNSSSNLLTTSSGCSSGCASVSTSTASNNDVFHYVSFVLVNNHLYELDGLKPYPIDHGFVDDTQNWSKKFFKIINERIHGLSSNSSDIRYNLMAVVPDKMSFYRENLKILEDIRERLKFDSNLKDLSIDETHNKIKSLQSKLKEEEEKRKKYRIDAQRRKHKYDDFIVAFIYSLIENGQLHKIIESQYDVKSRSQGSTQHVNKKLRKK